MLAKKGRIYLIMKNHTDLPQSKRLAEFLSIESADMFFSGCAYPKEFHLPTFGKTSIKDNIPCWSLAALLNVIPKRIKDYNVLRIDISENEFAIWYDEIGYGVNNDLPNITMESAIDACYNMILKLKEKELI